MPLESQRPAYSTLEGARLSFAAAWAEAERILLVVDESDYIEALADAIAAAGGTAPNKRLVFTSRERVDGYEAFEVPPLTVAEARQILEASAPLLVTNTSLLAIGNPLALQRALAESEAALPANDRADSAARELLAYLSLSDVPLSAEELLELLGDDRHSIELLYTDLGRLGRLVDDSPRGFRLMHEQTAADLREELTRTPQRLRFYVNRLVRLFVDKGDLRTAYMAASIPKDGSERRFAVAALRQAAQLGDWRLGTTIADQLLVQAIDAERQVEALSLMLSLVYPLELMGDAARASELIGKAKSLAEAIGGPALAAVEEAELTSRARRTLLAADVEGMEALHARYGEMGRRWDQARLAIDLSALYIAAKAYEPAVATLRPALATFEELGDEYGIDTAERNLAVSLGALPGNQQEAERLLDRIAARAGANVDTRRQRAWLCNILTRQYRQSARYAEAEALAKEAIQIAEDLGDEALQAINLINLGNIYANQGWAVAALEAYAEAGRSAQKCARRDVEADSSRLQASVLNDLPDDIEGFPDRHERARLFAEHAVGLLAGTIYHDARAHALHELGDALQALHQPEQAARAYFEAAAEFAKVPDEDGVERSLFRATTLALPDHLEIYLDGLADALGVARPTDQALADRFINLVGPILVHVPRGALVPLLGRHLQRLRSEMPPLLRPALVEAVISVIGDYGGNADVVKSLFRMLHAGLALAFLLKDDPRPFLHAKLAETITKNVSGLDARELGDGRRLWTVVVELDSPVTVSIEPFDVTPPTMLASFGLALFMKAFEDEMREQLVRQLVTNEVLVQVGTYEAMPEDFRATLNETMATNQVLAEQRCAVTRPTTFNERMPTVVILAPNFVEGVVFGEGLGGALQELFGRTLIEVVFQLLRGEVDLDEIEPKVVSLVRETIS